MVIQNHNFEILACYFIALQILYRDLSQTPSPNVHQRGTKERAASLSGDRARELFHVWLTVAAEQPCSLSRESESPTRQ